MRLKTFFMLTLCTFLFTGACSSALAAEASLESILSRYSEVDDVRFSFTQTLVHQTSGGQDEQKGFLHFKKPMLVYWEITAPAPELIVVTKDSIWNVFPDVELAKKYSLELANDSANLIRVISGLDKLEKDFLIEENGSEDGLRIVHLYPKEPTQSLTEAILWLDEKNRTVKRIRVYDFYSNQNELRFETEETNLHPEDSLFTYTPPSGFDVEDLSEGGALPVPQNQ